MTTKIIAELGWNAIGDMGLSKEMIDAAAENGADYAKFQVWSVNRLKPGPWTTDGRKELYQKAELDLTKLLLLKEHCEKVGIEFLATPFTVRDARVYKATGARHVKIASCESRNIDLLKYNAENFDLIYMSTGTSTINEIRNTIKASGIDRMNKLVLLHCVSQYPTRIENVNLTMIDKIRRTISCKAVGYSDHSLGVEAAKMAMEYNPYIIEKHFTLSRSLAGKDNIFSITPGELKDLSDYIKNRELAMTEKDEYQDIERNERELHTGRWDG